MIRLLLLVFGTMVSATALAHPGPHADGTFAAGFWHPFTGLDHLLAMVCVGLWAAQLGGRCRFAVPAAFVLSMAAGIAAAAIGVSLGLIEFEIALSVLILGALVAFSARVPWYGAVPLVSAFAVFHGYAHGVEMPALGGTPAEIGGLLAATALLHCVGVISGLALRRQDLVRGMGAAISLAGLYFVLS